MGRAGFVSGAVYAQNVQAGIVPVTLGGTGTDTATVVFKKRFQKIPAIVLGSNAVTSQNSSAVTLSGFTLNIRSSSLTSTVDISYVAVDDTYD